MFSLIITVVSIALVAALALATLYYGGTAYTLGQANAQAAKLLNQGQQLLAASELFKVQNGRYPGDVPELVNTGYLRSNPVAHGDLGAMSEAWASTTWTMPLAREPVFTIPTPVSEACRSVNAKGYGSPGILPTVQAGVLVQCFSSSTNGLVTVVGRNGVHLAAVAAAGTGGFVAAELTGAPIPPAGDAAWAVDPAFARGAPVAPGAPPAPAAEGILRLTPTSLDFGAVATNTTSTLVVELANTGAGALPLSTSPLLSGDLTFIVGFTTCGSSIPAGQSCQVSLNYSPTLVVASATAALTVTSGSANTTTAVAAVASAFNPVSLGAAPVPVGTVGQAFSFNFNDRLNVSNEAAPDNALATWAGAGALPSGLSMSASTGVLSGTPDAANAGAAYTVTGTYKSNTGQQVYTIVVNGVTLNVSSLASGGYHTCAVTTAGALKCWGFNDFGGLGDGSTTNRHTPVSVVGMDSGVTMASAGTYHTCAVQSGALKCWGYNDGQLGDGSMTYRFTPVSVVGMDSGVTLVSVGGSHTCAVQSGALKCWGRNTYEQLGDGSTVDRHTPVSVVGMGSGVTLVSAGLHQTCAVQSGAVKCWGFNDSGQLGDGSTTNRLTPVSVVGMGSGVTMVSAGGFHTCAVQSGALKCWGANSNGQLGDGSRTSSSTPVSVVGMDSGVTLVSAGMNHTCAVQSGAVKCWGFNDSGQLGDGSTVGRFTPVSVVGMGSGVTMVSAGGYHTCAVQSSALKCWGFNGLGQLGDGSTVNHLTPVLVQP
jgi:alpha-tubulin suppressor-like RCC1 family protein